MLSSYFSDIQQLLSDVEHSEKDVMQQCSLLLAASFSAGGILHVFGCGHSHMMAEEVFFRAGGMVPIRPIFVEDLMLHKGALRSSELEKDPYFAETFLPSLPFEPNDVLLVASTSGRNPVPIDVALYGKEKGMKVLTISSHSYHELTSRHSSGKFLAEVADIAVNSRIPQGDALIRFPKMETSVGPGSTIINAAILNNIIVQTVEILLENGQEVPILKSGNIDGSEQHNKKWMNKYQARVGLF